MKRKILDGIVIINSNEFRDDRGRFSENFNLKKIRNLIKKRNINFVQDNLSISKKGVFRGMHFQHKYPQAKLVSVLSGEILDIVIDLRESSKTFGDWAAFKISSKNKKQLFIPVGFAHGFLSLANETTVMYKVSEYRHPKDEYTLRFNDEIINLKLPFDPTSLSLKDQKGSSFDDVPKFK